MSLPVDKALRKAQSHIKVGELAEAEELYKQILSKFPKNKKAIQAYQKLKAGITSKGLSNSEPPQEQVQELINLYNHGHHEKALEKVKSLISLFPKAITLHNIQGASNAVLQRYDAAIESYKQAIKIKPDYAEAYSNMGVALKDQGDLDAAIDSYKQALKIRPDHADAYSNMGNALKDRGDLDAAIDNYKQAIKIKPDYAEAYYNMGVALKDKGELDATIDSYKQAIKIKPDYAEAYSNMGIALKDKGELDAAIDSYKQAIKIKPDYAKAYSNMGISLQDKGELDAAIDSCKQAIKIKPDYAEAYYNMGIALKDKGEFDAAIDSYKQAIKIKPEFAKVKHLLASLIGETTKAAPREYVEDLFDQYAPKFEHSLVEKMEYRIPKIITDMIIKTHPSKALGSVLDLGCGTGLAGLELKQFCENLDGIDLSKSMLEQARAKGVYDKLMHGDIIEHLTELELDFDYFISTDVFIYVGELSDIFRLIKSKNERPGKLAFSTEHTERQDFHLETSGRYSHSKNYIEGLCNKYGYHLSHFEKTKLRKEKSEFLTGGLYLLDFDPAE